MFLDKESELIHAWTSDVKRGYMVVTLHYLDSDWTLRSVIITFIRVLYPYTAERLANHLSQEISAMDGELLGSLWSITTDNASTNPEMVAIIQAQLDAAIN